MLPFRPERFRHSLPRPPVPDEQQPDGQPDQKQAAQEPSRVDEQVQADQEMDFDDYDDRTQFPPAQATASMPSGHRSPEEALPPVIYPAPVYTYNLRPLPQRTSSRPAGQPQSDLYPYPQRTASRDQEEAAVEDARAPLPAGRVAAQDAMQRPATGQPAGPGRRDWAFNLRDSDTASSTVPTEPRAHRQHLPTEPRSHRLPAPGPPPPAPPAPQMAAPPAPQPAQQPAIQPAATPVPRPTPPAEEDTRTVDGEPGVRLLTYDEWDRLTRAWRGGPWTLDWWPEGLPFTRPEQWATRHFWSGELHLDFNDPTPEDPWIPCAHCRKAHWFISTQKNPGERFYKCGYNRHPEDCRMFSYKGPLMRDGKIKLGTVVLPAGHEPDRYPPANLIVRPPERVDPRIEYLRDMRNRQNQRQYNEIQERYRQARADGERARDQYAAKKQEQEAARQEAARQEAARQEAARQEAVKQEAVKQEQAAQAAAVRSAPPLPQSDVGPEHYQPGESPLPDGGAAPRAPPSRPPPSPTLYRPPVPQSRNAPALRRTNTASFAQMYASITGGDVFPRDTDHDLVPTAGLPAGPSTSSSHLPTPLPQHQPLPGSRVPTPIVRQPGSRVPTPLVRQPGSRLPTPVPRVATPMPPPPQLIPPPPTARQPTSLSPALPPAAVRPEAGQHTSSAPMRQWRGPLTTTEQPMPERLDKGKGKAAEKRPAEQQPEGAPPARRARRDSVSSRAPWVDSHIWPIGTAPDPENVRRDLAALASTGGPQTRLTMLHLMAGILADPNVLSEELRETMEPVINHAIDEEALVVQQEEERARYDERVRREHRAH
ncbi:hypothetical protein CALCODRAFT_483786 [Calocera cornea HHB12733]|uniref:Uncharacterized protein n=1 Tax=Calocera cornea HHB12733 TaxID=1353952 RepID=A0A165FF02_9BASI|nr:hypothetical protein CALCODRAFT_483786 [Calocera cornea HHB12733]